MRVYQSIGDFEAPLNSVVTTGTFDGVHLGHRVIVDRVNQISKKIGGQSIMLTFHPHPRKVLFPDLPLHLLTTIDEKIELLKKAGLDHLVIAPFSREFSRMTATEYVRDLLVGRLNVKKLVIGYDHQFGRNREGSLRNLQECAPTYGFEVEEIPAQEIDAVNISSTKIRKALETGDLATANQYLGYQFSLTGEVQKGNQLGRTIGFPTANINIESSDKLIPMRGVYACKVLIDGTLYHGMVNIGTKPTVQSLTHENLEVHVFNFDKDIYNQDIKVSFVKRLRNEEKFENTEALKAQLQQDRLRALTVLGNS